MGKFGLFALGVLLGVAGLAFAQSPQPQIVNPLCSMVQALASNWGIITVLVMVILGGIVIVSAVMNLVQGKFAFALAVVIGGAVLLIAAYRLIDAAGGQLDRLSTTCQRAQIEIVKPVAKLE
jgi:ABC-type transport system involved in cytochrome c biogenesis permease subunit